MAHAIRSLQKSLNKVANGLKWLRRKYDPTNILSVENDSQGNKHVRLWKDLLKQKSKLDKRMEMLKFYGSDQ